MERGWFQKITLIPCYIIWCPHCRACSHVQVPGLVTAALSPPKCDSAQAVLSTLCIMQHTGLCKSKEYLCCVNYKINSMEDFHMLLSLMCPFLHWRKHLSVPVLLHLLLPSCTSCTNEEEDLSFQHKGKLNSLPPHYSHPFSFLSSIENSTSLMSACYLKKKKKSPEKKKLKWKQLKSV